MSDLPNQPCPSQQSTLATFAIVNAVVSLLSLIFGNRYFVDLVTPRCMRTESQHMWMITWTIPLAIQLAANAFIAFLYKDSPGYDQGFSLHDLTLFFITRPRLGWFVLAILMPLGRAVDKHGMYESAAKGAIVAEIFLLLIGSYYMGITAHFAATNGYYVGALQGPYAEHAHMMYSGALLFLISLAFALISALLLLPSAVPQVLKYVLVFIVAISSLLGSWLFWAGYVLLAGDL